MFASVAEHVIYKIRNAEMRQHPFPHFYIESIFPDDYYQKLRANWPAIADMTCLADTGRVTGNRYRERFILALESEAADKLSATQAQFWRETADGLLGDEFKLNVISAFEPFFPVRFGAMPARLETSAEALVVRDLSNYAITPHTDIPSRLLSLLFYCPKDDSQVHLGTSIYVPKDPSVALDPNLHYSIDLFTRIATMEYKPNSLFAFLRTDYSYHGVEMITAPDVERDLLLYDIRLQKVVMAAPTATNTKKSWLERTLSRLIS